MVNELYGTLTVRACCVMGRDARGKHFEERGGRGIRIMERGKLRDKLLEKRDGGVEVRDAGFKRKP